MRVNSKPFIPKKEYLYEIRESEEDSEEIERKAKNSLGVFVMYDCKGIDFSLITADDFKQFGMKCLQLK